MTSMVLELQREAYDQSTSVSILLRKAYTLAKKLRVTDFEKWAELELNGYVGSKLPMPDYREVHGVIKAFNPYHGYIPAYFPPEIAKTISKRSIPSPITEIEEHIKQGDKKANGMLTYRFPTELQRHLMEMTEVGFEVTLHIPTTQFRIIIDRVRNIILEWTLKLEEEKILGEGMTFTDMEKEKASRTAGTIVNIIGSMANSQLQQNTISSTQSLKVEAVTGTKEDLLSLISEVKKLQEEVVDQETKDELAAEISVLESQVNSPKPKNGIIGETLKSIRNISEGTTGSLIATGIQSKIQALLPLFGIS